MSSALIGRGFIGQTLMRQTKFDRIFGRTNVRSIFGNEFDMVVCAAMPGSKRVANADPDTDAAELSRLQELLQLARCTLTPRGRLVLISTVDVFKYPVGVDEFSPVVWDDLQAYGKNRLKLEQFVAENFPNHLIVRLPACVGPGLNKNVVYDLHNGVHLDQIDCRSAYQFYPTVNLWYDIQEALKRELNLIHLTAEPMSVEEVSREGFGRTFGRKSLLIDSKPARYDVWTEHAMMTGRLGNYHYSKRESIQAIRAYAQSEPRAGTGFPA